MTRGGALLAAYAYDANGNRTSVTTGAGTIAATYDDQDRILTFGDRTYTHTTHGDVRSWSDLSGTTTLTYDVQGNLLAVNLPSGTTVEYVVDARNRRIGRKVNDVVTHRWLYQGQLRPVAELDGSGAVITRFVYGARAVTPEYMVRAGVTYRLITDHLGSVRVVVNNTSGAITQRIDYDSWGQVTNDTNPGFQPFGFAGGLYESASGLVRFGMRDYDAKIGRWLAKDPTRMRGGDANLYAYVLSDPINLVDPSGLSWMDSALATTANLSAGFGDTLTSGFGVAGLFGLPSLTEAIRGNGPGIDKCSTAYGAGQVAGYAWGVAFAGSVGLNGGADSVFWAGAGAEAEAAALGTTIAQTPIGSALVALGVQSRLVWGAASAAFAANATGAVAVIRYVDPNSIWRLERFILNVRNIRIVDK